MTSNRPSTYLLTLILLTIYLIFTVINTYFSTLNNAFVWDSMYYLHGNPYITQFSIGNITWMFIEIHISNWHPITWLSYNIDYMLYGGLDPWGFHLTNVILHAINSVILLFLIIALLKITFVNSPGTTSLAKRYYLLTAAFAGSLIFAIHPLRVESVAWVAERKDLLFFLFLQLSLLTYIKFTQVLKRKIIFYAVSIACFALALMSKPMAVTFPVVLLIVDYYPLKRFTFFNGFTLKEGMKDNLYILVEKVPFFLLSMVVIYITLASQSTAMIKIEQLDLIERIYNAFRSIGFYLQKSFIPVDLSPYYPHPGINEKGKMLYVPYIFVFLFISTIAFYLWRKGKPALLVAWVFYIVTLSPVLGVIQVGTQAAADRYTYFTTLPIYIFVSAAIFIVLSKARISMKIMVVTITIFSIYGLIDLTKDQTKVWNSRISLWKHAADLYPDDGHIHGNLATAYFSYGDHSSAAYHYQQALRHGYLSIHHLTSAALTYIKLENLRMALALYYTGLTRHHEHPAISPLLDCIQYNAGLIQLELGGPKDAYNAFKYIPKTSRYYQQSQAALANHIPEHNASIKQGTYKPGFCWEVRRHTF